MNNINASFPEMKAIRGARNFKERDGSVGGGFLSRFTVIVDYGNRKMRLKKNKNFNSPFHYNMSGLTLEHDGKNYVKQARETSQSETRLANGIPRSSSVVNIPVYIEFEFNLVPRFVVVEVLEGSPAAQAGIEKGDEITRINATAAHKYHLAELIELFSHKEGSTIKMEIKRNGMILKKKFVLGKLF